MANFVLLKGGEQYKVFDFGGNVARVGSGEHVDLQIVDTGTESDIFLLMLTDRGYDLQPIAPEIAISVNGQPANKRVSLEEQAKVSFLDYLMIVTYGEQPAAQAQTDVADQAPALPVSEPDEKTLSMKTPAKTNRTIALMSIPQRPHGPGGVASAPGTATARRCPSAAPRDRSLERTFYHHCSIQPSAPSPGCGRSRSDSASP